MFDAQKVALVFPGQGSQHIGMAQEFLEESSTKELFEQADDTLGFGLTELMMEGEATELALTHNTQPALLLASYAAWAYMAKASGLDIRQIAGMVAGHSLGEYSALLAAGVFDFETALKLVRLRGEAMQRAVPVGEGTMAAVIGLTPASMDSIARNAGCWVANDNSEAQAVFTGSVEAVDNASNLAADEGAKRVVRLDVSAPFHCPMMDAAAKEMEEALAKELLNSPKVPVIHNVTVQADEDPKEIAQRLVEQVTGTVRWRETMDLMAKKGIEHTFELGSGKVLTGLLKRGVPGVNAQALNGPRQIDTVLESLIKAKVA